MLRPCLVLLISLLSFLPVYGVLFEQDNRHEIHEAPEDWQNLARSVPALVPREYMVRVEGGWQLTGIPLKNLGLCEDEPFSDQRIIANCSASLVGEDLILTAAHCLDDQRGRGCDDYAIVFDYRLDQDNPYFVAENQVYFCDEVLYHQFILDFTEDIALLRLTQAPSDRKPIRVNPRELVEGDFLNMIGYPLGIFQKWVDFGEVTHVEPERMSFKHTLDTFSVNSGGPIFDGHTGEQVGVLVRGTGGNLSDDGSCTRWREGQSFDFAEGNSLSHLPFFKRDDELN